MRLPSCLTDPNALLVADASVAINLNATGCAAQILRALPNRIVITGVAADEVTDDRQNGRRDAELLANLTDEGLVEIVHLSEAAEAVFGQLVIGPAIETLDDGEAATIAHASEHGGIAIIDERKANRICAQRFAELRMASTIDVLANRSVQDALGRQELGNAVFNALRQARMRILPHHGAWVTSLIGPERASLCGSLPPSFRLLRASS